MFKRPALLLLVFLSVSILATDDAEAGRRSIRVDAAAWEPAIPIVPYEGAATEACPGAGVSASLVIEPQYQQGFVLWNSIMFQMALTNGLVLTDFYCQHSRAYEPSADPAEYMNEAVFAADEQGLASMVGANTDNAVSAIRYSFLQSDIDGEFSRQWAFYFFPDDLTVVALYGVKPGDTVYPFELIYDLIPPYPSIWSSTEDGFSGQYFCFEGRDYIGDCVPPEPPIPEEVFDDGFEDP